MSLLKFLDSEGVTIPGPDFYGCVRAGFPAENTVAMKKEHFEKMAQALREAHDKLKVVYITNEVCAEGNKVLRGEAKKWLDKWNKEFDVD